MIKNKRIYIVDDNEAVCDALVFLFQTFCNVKINTYNDPCLFLEEFSVNWSGCILIDLFMPSMSGIELMKKLKSRNSLLKIIIMSGHGTEDIALKSIETGASFFITKPFKTKDLLDKVKELLQ